MFESNETIQNGVPEDVVQSVEWHGGEPKYELSRGFRLDEDKYGNVTLPIAAIDWPWLNELRTEEDLKAREQRIKTFCLLAEKHQPLFERIV